MTWYWILLIIIGYFIISFLTALLYYFVFDEESENSAFLGILWPIALPIAILCFPIFLIQDILDSL